MLDEIGSLILAGVAVLAFLACVAIAVSYWRRGRRHDDMLLVLIGLLALSACDRSATLLAGYKTLAVASKAGSASAKAWTEIDRAQERKILDDARARGAYRDEVAAELAAWRIKSDRVDKAIDAFGSVVTTALLAVEAAEEANGKLDLVAWVGPLYYAGLALAQALDVAGVKLPAVGDFLREAWKLLSSPSPMPEATRRLLVAATTLRGGL